MTPALRMFKRALSEKLAFVPLGAAAEKLGQQASGPGGQPVDPAAAGAPMDPAAAPPMDPAAMGMPADPAAAGAPPMDPAAMGMPADPAAAGAPPMDPAALAAPEENDPMAAEPAPAEENSAATDTDNDGKPDTMVPLNAMKDFAVSLIEAMKGKKTQDAAAPDAAGKPAGQEDPAAAPGPVTGLPGLDPSMLGGPMKLGSVMAKVIKLK